MLHLYIFMDSSFSVQTCLILNTNVASVCVLFFNTDQRSDSQVMFSLVRHWIMVHCQKDDVDDEADNNPEVKERVHDDGVELLFEHTPTAATVPRQELLT